MDKDFMAGPLPKEEAPNYAGIKRNYPDKELWFESKAFNGFLNAYKIVKGNGDDTFDMDAFINSKHGELVLSRVKYELCLLGNDKWGCPEMIEYWKRRGVIETDYNAEDKKHEFVTFVPDYMRSEGNKEKYPLVIDYHGGGGTIFESINHGFVDICYENRFMVVCPECEGTNTRYCSEHLEELIDELLSMGYPIDTTKIYLVGHSMGGVASIYGGLHHSSRIAAIAPHSCSGIFGTTMNLERLTDEMYQNSKAVPMFLEIGGCDFKQLPLAKDVVEGLNKWLELNGCNKTEPTSGNFVGITGDKVYTKNIDETEYSFVEFFNNNQVNMVKVIGVKGLPHWVAYSYSKLAWEFLSQFSRDAEGN